MLHLDFDWLSSPKVTLNILISAVIIAGGIATGVYAAGGGWKATVVAFVGGVLGALKERMSKKPDELVDEGKLAAGQLVGRRASDRPGATLPPPEPTKETHV
jgi:hypothetical protein